MNELCFFPLTWANHMAFSLSIEYLWSPPGEVPNTSIHGEHFFTRPRSNVNMAFHVTRTDHW